MEHRRSSSRSRSRQQTERSFTEKCKDYLRQFLAFLFSNIGIICLVIGYTIAGECIIIIWLQSGGARPRIGRAWVRYQQGLRIFYSFIWESKVRVHCSREVVLKMLLQHNPWGLVFTGGLIFQCLKLKVNFNWKSTLTVILTVLKRCSLIPPIAWDLKVCPQFHTSTLPR